MEINFSKEQCTQAFEHLPESLRAGIVSMHTFETIRDIAKENGFDGNQLKELGDTVGLVMMGLVKREDFFQVLQMRIVNIPLMRNVTIAIDKMIFEPYAKELASLPPLGTTPAPEKIINAPASAPLKIPGGLPPPPPPPPSMQRPSAEATSFQLSGSKPIDPSSPTSYKLTANSSPLTPETVTNILEDKLHERVQSPAKERVITTTKPLDVPRPPTHTYAVDPYREPAE